MWLCIFPGKGQAQIGIKVPKPPRVISLFEPEVYGLEKVAVDSMLTIAPPKSVKRTVTFDSTFSYVSFAEAVDKSDLVLPAVVDLDTYIKLRLKFQIRELWKTALLGDFKPQEEKEFGAIELDIPFKIKSKTFTRIFGSDRIGLRVTGNISFDLSGRTESRSGSAVSAVESQNTFSPRFKQQQQFTVEGKIGDKVTVSVEQNSEAVTDIENTLKLRYDGDEDEIVQKIEAGNISLSLPSTKYVIFGGSNQGLFGLKTQMKMGNLNMTAIASLEKGQQQELSISGSSQSSKTVVKDINFIKNQYFFVDKFYRDHYEDGIQDNNPTSFTYVEGHDIIQLDVFESENYAAEDARLGVALINPDSLAKVYKSYSNIKIENIKNLDDLVGENKAFKGYFRRLNPDVDYTFERFPGYLKLANPVSEQKTLAIAYVVSDPNLPKIGTLNEDLADTNQAVILKLIKPIGMQPSDTDTWPLMMRNVYSLGGQNIEPDGFDVRLEYNATGTNATRPEGKDQTFLNILGLDVLDENGGIVQNGDEVIDANPNIIDRSAGILIFPSLQPFNPVEGSKYQGRLDENYLVDMYNEPTSNSSEIQQKSKFEMIVTSKSTKSEFDLGFYVLEGSEVVTLGGVTLKRDTDYIIDYFSGKLTLLSSEAKRSSSSLDIKYERANLFQLDKKTIFGGRMEYNFWENSFIGLTALYLSKSTIDDRVRVGQEPFENFVWDLNTALKFEPRFITKALDWLPVIETNAPSNFNIEGEFAQVLPNPNTLNSNGTGDKEGVAYLDDFEASKRTTTLGIRYRTWTMASPPKYLANFNGPTPIDSTVNNHRAHIAWFNPYVQTPITDIWPNREVNARTGKYTDVLGIDLWRDENSDPDMSWCGMMRSTLSFYDQLKTKYIEVWILGDKGTVNIDIGRISEDWYMKGKNIRGEPSYRNLNTEDRIVNGLLDEGEDTGIDGIPNGNAGDDPTDNWSEPQKVGDYYIYDGINGTEGNSNSRDARYPDTEDLDGDGQLSTNNDYFEYSFSLDPNDPKYNEDWVEGKQSTGWRQYRIPIKEPTAVIGNPDPKFQQIYNVRLWFSNLPTERTRIRIATFDFVGNEWEENGVADNDTSITFTRNDSLFKLATYNSEENPNEYTSPPGVTGTLDRITDTRSKEQSLAFIINDLQAGQIAEAQKTLYNAAELVNYKKMRMFVHGDDKLPFEPPANDAEDSSQIQLYIRFGSNAENYYEYGQDIYAGWNTAYNNFDIDLDELSALKSNESYDISTVDKTIFYHRLYNKPGAYYKAVGNPSLKTVRYFIVGVRHLGKSIRRESSNFSGQIWIDELRLSEVRKEKATALRVSTSLKLADVMTFNAQWESVDADFHNISTQFGEGSTNEIQNYSGKLTFDKFLPASWDLSIPIDGRANFSRSIPKYKHGSDELTKYQNNTIDKKLKSLFGLRAVPADLEDEITKSEVYGVGTTIKKRSKSKRWYIRYTLDEVVLDFDYSWKNSGNWEYLYNKSEQYKESFKYSIPFAKDNFFQPFHFVSTVPVLKKISDQKLYYTPGSMNFSLNVSDLQQDKLRRQSTDQTNEISHTGNTGTNRSFNTSYQMLNSLNFTYSRSWQSDADFDSLTHGQLWKSIITKLDFGLDTDINQSFKADYAPTLLDWLDPDFSYSNNFSYNLTNGYQYKNSLNQTQKGVNLTFSPSKLMKAIYTPGSSKKSSSTRQRSRRSNRDNEQGNDNNNEESQNEKKSVSVPNPLMWLYKLFSSWQSIRGSYSVSQGVTNRYLTEMPSWSYQFGLTQNPGVPQDSSLVAEGIKLIGPQLKETTQMKLSTSANISSTIKASFSYDRSNSETSTDYNLTRTGTKNSTYFVWSDDPQKDFKDLTSWRAIIPDWSVQISGVEKLLFFSQFAQNISIDHGHTSKYSENLSLNQNKEFLPTNQTFSNNWQPLVGVNLKTKWGIGGTVRYTSSTNFSYTSAGGASKTVTNAFSISMNYAKSTGFKIPLPIWPFKGKTFKNEINFSLTYDASNNQTFQRQFNQPKFEEKQKNSNWKLRPSATYRFSKRIQGSLFYERGSTENKITGTYTYNEFGITVNIAIRD